MVIFFDFAVAYRFCYVLRRLQRRENWARPLKNAMIANFWHGHELAEALPMTHAVAAVTRAQCENHASWAFRRARPTSAY